MIGRALAWLRTWVEDASNRFDRLHLDAHRAPGAHGPACGCPRCDETRPEARTILLCAHPPSAQYKLDSYRWTCGVCGDLLDPPH